MELTRVKVRGKRLRKSERNAPEESRPQKKIRSGKELVDAVRKKRNRPMSLDMLPLEVLEHIFILSENPNFARCNPLLGSMLSSRGLLMRLLIAAFGPTWANWVGRVCNQVESYDLLDEDGGQFGGHHEFQVRSCVPPTRPRRDLLC